MSLYDQTRDSERKLKNEAANTAKDFASEVNQLKENVTQLTQTAKTASNQKVQAASDYIRSRVLGLKASGEKSLEQTEAFIREKPGQSIALAFAAGVIAHILLGRGRS